MPLAVLTTVLHRFGLLDTTPALVLLGIAISLALLALVLGVGALAVIWARGFRGTRQALVGILCAALVLAWPLWTLSRSLTLPAINDVTTDWFAPPSLDWAAPLRPEGSYPTAYPGRDFALKQREAYPEVVPVMFGYTADLVFDTARALVADRGWEEVAALPPDAEGPGTIDVIAHTPVFGFRDDVAIIVTRLGPEETRVDMRSASRIGRHDLGANAERIYGFLTELAARLEAPALPEPVPAQ